MTRKTEMQVKATKDNGVISIVVFRDEKEVLNISCEEGQNAEWLASGAAISIAFGLTSFMKPQGDEVSE